MALPTYFRFRRWEPSTHTALATISMLSLLVVGGCAVTPNPLGKGEISSYAAEKIDGVAKGEEPVLKPISLYEAIARALKYDLDQRVELAQQSLRTQELDLANYQGLPNFVANSGYTGRNNNYGGSDLSLLTGQESLVPSTGQPREDVASDATLSWNVLDFGLSYVKAQQASDQVLIAKETRRKVLARIVEDVRTAYWRAVASQRLSSRLHALEARTKAAIADSHALYNAQLTSPITALTYERELIDIQNQVQRIDSELTVARSQLAALMNLPPNSQFDLDSRLEITPGMRLVSTNRELIQIALENRSEVRDLMYRSRINEKDAEAALLNLLPGVNLFLGADNDTNKLLYNANWVGWGAKASWNLMKVFQYPAVKQVIDDQGKLIDERALALTMAIMTQVSVSKIRYAHAQQELQTAAQYRDVEHKLVDQMRASAQSDKVSEQTLIREEMNLVIGDVKYDLSYADLQNAYANIYASLGLDAFPVDEINNESVDDLAATLRKTWVAIGNAHISPRAHNSSDDASSDRKIVKTEAKSTEAVADAAPEAAGVKPKCWYCLW